MVRKPEKGTGPKVFYLGADESAIRPEIGDPAVHLQRGQGAPAAARIAGSPDVNAPRRPARRLRRAAQEGVGHRPGHLSADQRHLDRRDVPLRAAVDDGRPVAARRPRRTRSSRCSSRWRPRWCWSSISSGRERFLYILTRPNWTSWLARGAFLLTAHGAIATSGSRCYFAGRTAAMSLARAGRDRASRSARPPTRASCSRRVSRAISGRVRTRRSISSPRPPPKAAPRCSSSRSSSAATRQRFARWRWRSRFASRRAPVDSGPRAPADAEPDAAPRARGARRPLRRLPALFWIGALGLGGLVPLLLVWFASTNGFSLTSSSRPRSSRLPAASRGSTSGSRQDSQCLSVDRFC